MIKISGVIGGKDVRRLRAAGSETEIAAGQMLIERGQPGAGMYLVLEGSVVVETRGRVRELGPGSFVGERALLFPNGTRTARVRAKTRLRVVAVGRDEFEQLSLDDPGLGLRLAVAGVHGGRGRAVS
jgi:CRP-like cAMP-binding protein